MLYLNLAIAFIAKVAESRTVLFIVKCLFSSLLFYYKRYKFTGTCTYIPHVDVCIN